MAIVKPFKGIRPPKDLVEQVESRPYDVLDSEEARAEAGDNEKSLYHIIKPEINFEPGTSEYDPRVYESAAENFRKFQENGWLKQDDKEQYYIYICRWLVSDRLSLQKDHTCSRRKQDFGIYPWLR